MRNRLNIVCMGALLCTFVAASCAKVEKISRTELQKTVVERKDAETAKKQKALINFHNLSFRKKLDADARKSSDWWTPLEIGEEVIVLSSVVKDSAGVEYVEIQRTNLKKETGFARSAFVAIGARLAVVSGQEAFRYSSQSLTRLTKDTVPFMSLIAVFPDTSYEGLIEFDYNNERGVVFKDQYIEESQISYGEADIDTAKFVFLAKITKDPILQGRFLQKAKDFNSNVFRLAVEDFLAIVKNNFSFQLKEGLLRELSPAQTVVPTRDVTYRSQPSAQGIPLGVLPTNQEVTLTYETIERNSLDGFSAPWYLVPNQGWVFGADIYSNFTPDEDEKKKDKK